MPPKRGRPAKSTSSKQAKPQSTRTANSKRSLGSAVSTGPVHSDAEILKAFHLFAVSRADLDEDDAEYGDDDGEGVIKIADVRRCLSALNLPKPPLDFFDDPDQTHISASDFLALAQTLRDSALDEDSTDDSPTNEADGGTSDEVTHAFALFTHNRPGDNVRITIADLRRIAKDLREDVDEATLKLMIEEANGEQGRESIGRGVALRDFKDVMRRAKVFK